MYLKFMYQAHCACLHSSQNSNMLFMGCDGEGGACHELLLRVVKVEAVFAGLVQSCFLLSKQANMDCN